MMDRRRFNRHLTRFHKWAGLVLGLFIVSWFASGFFMTLKPISEVRGRHVAEEPKASVNFEGVLPIESFLGEAGAQWVQIIDVIGRPAYVISTDEGREVYDARTGSPLPPVSEAAILAKAEAISKFGAEAVSIEMITEPVWGYGGTLPAYRVELSEPAGAQLFFDERTGALKSVRTRHWRAFDIAWRFHILDPAGETISTWWLRLASFSALIFALSGLIMVWLRTLGRPQRRLA